MKMMSALAISMLLSLALVCGDSGGGGDPERCDTTGHAEPETRSESSIRAFFRLPSILHRLKPSMTFIKTVVIAFLAISQSGLAARVCLDNRVPALADRPFSFCLDYSGSEACLAPSGSVFAETLYPSEDLISNEFNKINFIDGAGVCPSLVRRVLCSTADPWSSTLIDEDHQHIPHLCPAFSSLLWDECANVEMKPNPFNVYHGSPSPTLKDMYDTKEKFVRAHQIDDEGDECYSGVPLDQTKLVPKLPMAPSSNYLGEVCLQRQKFNVKGNQFILGGDSYPTDRNKMAIIDKDGVVMIWQLNDGEIASTEWLDLSRQVATDGSSGLLSIAFHKDFEHNGRLFLSMNCLSDAKEGPKCDKNGDLVIDEYYIEEPSKITTPVFSKRLLVIDGAFRQDFGSQLLFSPSDEDDNLYVFLGDGGQDNNDDIGDPFNFAQDLQSLHGKVLRINVDGAAPYEIPEDNPFYGVKGARGEIFALGLKNPWRCSFDRLFPEFLFCGDVGQHKYEEVDRIIAGGNYGWRTFEGRHVYNSSNGPSAGILIFPQIEYPHTRPRSPAAIIGGYVYRSQHSAGLSGTYFFADQFGKLYSAISVPGSGVYKLTPAAGVWRCAADSPVPCDDSIGGVFSFFESADADVYVCTSTGIYKIAHPGRCGLLLDP